MAVDDAVTAHRGDLPGASRCVALGLRDRRLFIAAAIGAAGFVAVRDLAQTCRVSAVTIRSDLAALECAGVVRRTHGGAVARGRVGKVPTR